MKKEEKKDKKKTKRKKKYYLPHMDEQVKGVKELRVFKESTRAQSSCYSGWLIDDAMRSSPTY